MFYRSLTENHAQRLRRARPVIALAGVAFAIGAIVGANHTASSAHALAARFVAAWAKGDYAAMYSDIDASSQRTTSAGEFAGAYQEALRTATATGLQVVGKPRDAPGGLVAVPVRVHTRLFGTLALSFTLKIVSGGGQGARIAWSRSLAFPGLRPGELLAAAPRCRGARRCWPATGASWPKALRPAPGSAARRWEQRPARCSGAVGPVPAARRQALEAQGVPPDAIVGVSGLERALDDRLRGTPGGELLAGQRVLASVAPHPAPAVRTHGLPRPCSAPP